MLNRQADLNQIEQLLKSKNPNINIAINDDGDKPIHVAIEMGDLALLKKIMQAGADINSPNHNGKTPLGMCYEANQEDMLEMLADAGVKPFLNEEEQTLLHVLCEDNNTPAVIDVINNGENVNAIDASGSTPLHIAAYHNNHEAINELLKAGADPFAKNKNGFSPLEIAIEVKSYDSISVILNTLLERGIDYDEKLTSFGETALHLAATINDARTVSYLLFQGADPDIADVEGNTPLFFAVLSGGVESANNLIKATQNNINQAVDDEQHTLLHYAAERDDPETFKLLVNAGANFLLKDADGITPCDIAIEKGNVEMIKSIINKMPDIDSPINDSNDTLLIAAIKEDEPQLVEEILTAGADPNISIASDAPILIAAANAGIDTFSSLFNHGAKLNSTNSDNASVVHKAAESDNTEVLYALLQANCDANATDKHHSTPLHYAAAKGSVDAAIMLSSVDNIQINAKDADGKTPVQIAIEAKVPDAINIFRHKGTLKPESTNTAEDYVKYTLKQKSEITSNNNVLAERVNNIGNKLITTLSNSNHPISQALAYLDKESRIKMMAAIITSDENHIKRFFSKTPFSEFMTDAGLDSNDLKYITKHENPSDAVQKRKWLSTTSMFLIESLMLDKAGQPYSDSVQKMLMTEAMSIIPDTQISLKAKHDIGKSVSDDFVKIRVAYNEFQKPLSDARSTGIVSPSSYKALLNLGKDNISQSDFILLTMGFMQRFAKEIEGLDSGLKIVHQLYAATEYDAAAKYLVRLADFNSDIIGDELFETIQHGINTFKSVDDDNFSRRFFENRYAALHHASFKGMDSVNRILNHFNFDEAKDENDMIKQITLLSEADMPDCFERMKELKRNSAYTQDEVRRYKESFSSKQGEAVDGKRSDSVLSRNTGVMKSTQPNYYDELSQHPLRNSPADILNATKSYSQYDAFKRGSFVAGISSHVYFTLAVLEKYAFENRHSKTLEQDINHFIQALAATYINRGYHGILEVMRIFEERSAKDFFYEKYGVHISTAYNSQTLAAACCDTQTYAETMCKRKLVNLDIQQKAADGSHLKPSKTRASGSSATLFHASAHQHHEKIEPDLQSGAEQNPRRPK